MATTATPSQQAASAFPNAKTVLHARGIPIRIDLTWVLIAALVLVQFVTRFTALLADLGTAAVLAAASVATLLFFASLLAHELGHAFASLDRGIPVHSITLFLLGGVTESTREATRARDEFVIVGIGPYTSLVLAGAFGLAYTAVAHLPVPAAIFGSLAWVNLLLAIFNVLPAYPLDGGRLLRSVLWLATGRAHAATRWAARVGQAFAAALALVGVVGLIAPVLPLRGGLWEILLGLFLFRGATEAHRRATLRERLTGRTAAELMGSVPAPLSPDASLAEALREIQTRPSLLWPVGAPLVGGITLADIDAVPQHEWHVVRVRDVAAPADAVSIAADAPLDAALERLAASPKQALIVVARGDAVGLLTPSLVGDVA